MNRRVVFVTEEYPPVPGGVATSSQRVAQSLTAAGCEVLVLTFDCTRPLSSSDYEVEARDAGVRVVSYGPFFHRCADAQVDSLNAARRALFRRRVYDRMEAAAGAFAPQVVLSFYAENAGLLGSYLSRSLEVPHVASIRGNDIGGNMFSPEQLPILQTVVASSAHLTCVNTYLHRRLGIAFPETRGRSSIVFNAVRLPEFPAAAAATGDVPVCAFVGALREKKGLRTLVEAFSRALGQRPLRLEVIGAEPQPADLAGVAELWAHLRAAGHLRVTGHRCRSEALALASRADLILMPSLDDGLANGLLEGMALGKCVIATEIFTDVVEHDVTGWVIRKGDPQALAEAILRLVADPARRAALGTAAQAHAQARFSPEREAADYLEIFERVTARA